MLLGEAIEGRRDRFAGPAPGCVEIDDEERPGFQSVECGEGFDFLHSFLRAGRGYCWSALDYALEGRVLCLKWILLRGGLTLLYSVGCLRLYVLPELGGVIYMRGGRRDHLICKAGLDLFLNPSVVLHTYSADHSLTRVSNTQCINF